LRILGNKHYNGCATGTQRVTENLPAEHLYILLSKHTYMKPAPDSKNSEVAAPLYPPGTVVYAKADPEIELSVLRYSRGVYYCATIGNAQNNNLPFLECQLQADEPREYIATFDANYLKY
jgi:hypothetical protein